MLGQGLDVGILLWLPLKQRLRKERQEANRFKCREIRNRNQSKTGYTERAEGWLWPTSEYGTLMFRDYVELRRSCSCSDLVLLIARGGASFLETFRDAATFAQACRPQVTTNKQGTAAELVISLAA
jgi:hypothetical protein